MNSPMAHFRTILLEQWQRYPKMQAQDLVKLIYQSEFGVGHFLPSAEKAWQRLKDEYVSCQRAKSPKINVPLVEEIGGGYSRVNLRSLPGSGLSLSTINQWFIRTAERDGGGQDFFKKLDLLTELCQSGEIDLPLEEPEAFLAAYAAQGYPALHHSETYRSVYQPAYRVVSQEFSKFHRVFAAIDTLLGQLGMVVVAIDGNSGAGKSTLAELLSQVYDCNVFHMDHFFLPQAQKTAARLSEPGGNVHYERFFDEVILGLESRRPFQYGVFDCSIQSISKMVDVNPKRLNIVEGSYSLHPHLEKAYDLNILLRVEPELQRARILERSGEKLLTRFVEEWIPLENRYFSELNIADRAHMILDIS